MRNLSQSRLLCAILIGCAALALFGTIPAAESDKDEPVAVPARRGSLDDQQVLRLLFGQSAQIGDGLKVEQPDLGQTLSSTALVKYLTSSDSHPFEMLRRGPATYRFSPPPGQNVWVSIQATLASAKVSGEATGSGVLMFEVSRSPVGSSRPRGNGTMPYVVRVRPDRVTISRVVRDTREEVVGEGVLEKPGTGAVPFSLQVEDGTITARLGTGDGAAVATAQVDRLERFHLMVGAADGPVTIRRGALALALDQEAWKDERALLAGMAVLEHVRRRDAQREMLVEIVRPTDAERQALGERLTPAQRTLLDRDDTTALMALLPEEGTVRRLHAARLLGDGRAGAALEVLGGAEATGGLRTPAAAVALAADRPELAHQLAGPWEPDSEKTDQQRLIGAIAEARGVVRKPGQAEALPMDLAVSAGSWLQRVRNGRLALERAFARQERYVEAPMITLGPDHRRWLGPPASRGVGRAWSVVGYAQVSEADEEKAPAVIAAVGCITDPWDFADAMLVLSDQRADMLGGVFVPGNGQRTSRVVVFGTAPGDAELERVLAHELTHAVIEKYFPRAARLPWLNEGAAVLVSATGMDDKGVLEHFLPVEAQGRVDDVRAFLTGPEAGRRIRALVRMGREDFHRPESVALNYAVSWALVWYAASKPEGFALADLLSGKVDAADINSERLGAFGAAAASALAELAQER